jgi:hypothetical protein
VVLLLSQFLSRTDLDGIERSRCDDVLALPVSSEDFYHHIAQVSGLPFQRAPRVAVELLLELGDGRVEQRRGVVTNVSPTGLGVLVSRAFDIGQAVTLRIRRSGEESDVPGRVVWCRPADSGDSGYAAGLEVTAEVSMRSRLLLEQLALFDVPPAPDEDGRVVVLLQGDFTEAVDFGPLRERLAGEKRIAFDMSAVRYVSSAGVKAWCELVAGLAATDYLFRHCSLAFASQAAMVPMVLGAGEVLSLEAPYHCQDCGRDDMRLLETRALLREGERITPPLLRCFDCGGALEFDDVPNRYFAFLSGPRGIR